MPLRTASRGLKFTVVGGVDQQFGVVEVVGVKGGVAIDGGVVIRVGDLPGKLGVR